MTSWRVRVNETVRELSLKGRKKVISEPLNELDVSLDVGQREGEERGSVTDKCW